MNIENFQVVLDDCKKAGLTDLAKLEDTTGTDMPEGILITIKLNGREAGIIAETQGTGKMDHVVAKLAAYAMVEFRDKHREEGE